MKTFAVTLLIICTSFGAFARQIVQQQPTDTLSLRVSGKNAFYQNTVKVDKIPEGLIYNRAVQFMASENFLQTYGYQEAGKLIFTTSQDLNINPVYVGDDGDEVEPYTVQFAVILDLKNNSYRYTINNVVFFLPTDYGNKRETLYDLYLKVTNQDSRRVAKQTRKLVDSFERYLNKLTADLKEGIEHSTPVYSKF